MKKEREEALSHQREDEKSVLPQILKAALRVEGDNVDFTCEHD
jgi:hypothetical protein